MRLAVALIALALVTSLRPAAAEKVDLELVLAVDVSGSIDEVEADLQRTGYEKALIDPAVIRAITSGKRRRIAVTYIEWAGAYYQRVVVDWTVVHDKASALAFVSKLKGEPVITAAWTSISGAIDYALKRFAANPYKGERRVLDISGDGRNNSGSALQPRRAAAIKAGITINGLPIINNRPNPYGRPPDRQLDTYYKTKVIGGPGAFIVVAEGFEAFAEAIRAKLIREIAGLGGPVVQKADASR